MALTVDAVTEATAADGTFNHTVAADANYILVLIAHKGGTISGVTYAGAAMTLVKTHTYINYSGTIYGLLNPATGTNGVVVSISGTANYGCGSISFKGVDPLVPINATATSQGNGTPATTITSTVDGCIGLDCWYSQSNSYFSFAGGQAEIFQSNPDTDTDRAGGSYKAGATAGNIALSTSGGEAGQDWGGCGVAVSPELSRVKLVTFY